MSVLVFLQCLSHQVASQFGNHAWQHPLLDSRENSKVDRERQRQHLPCRHWWIHLHSTETCNHRQKPRVQICNWIVSRVFCTFLLMSAPTYTPQFMLLLSFRAWGFNTQKFQKLSAQIETCVWFITRKDSCGAVH